MLASAVRYFLMVLFLVFATSLYAAKGKSVTNDETAVASQELGLCVGVLTPIEQTLIGAGFWTDAYAGRMGFPSRRPATGSNVFIFDPSKPAWAAYNGDGRLIRTGRASGGKNYCADVKRRCLTPRGQFRVHRKGSSACKSSKFPLGRGGAPMPHCMFFYRGYAIHGSYHVPNYNASHGCIRVMPKDAKWLHRNFMHMGTRVIVTPY